MRGKKSYNIRNIEAHLNIFRPQVINDEPFQNSIGLSRDLIFQTKKQNTFIPTEQQKQNEYINAKFGVSKYASNLVSGKMFKNTY